jgi:hypothetical protein
LIKGPKSIGGALIKFGLRTLARLHPPGLKSLRFAALFAVDIWLSKLLGGKFARELAVQAGESSLHAMDCASRQ